MDLARKFVVEQLAQPGARNVLDLPVDWYLAENQRFGNMEFFNRIGQKPTFRVFQFTTYNSEDWSLYSDPKLTKITSSGRNITSMERISGCWLFFKKITTIASGF